MDFVFLMDPLHTVNASKDTSFIFMVGAARAGHRCWFVPQGGISLVEGRVTFSATQVTPDRDRKPVPFEAGASQTLDAERVNAVFVRTEPPFDQRYLMDTWLLDRLPQGVPVINSPRGLRTVNEKIWATQFTDLIPPTAVTRSRQVFDAFLVRHGRIIAKPTDGFGGAGVFVVERGDTNASVIFETLSENGGREIILQTCIPEAAEGDKRILLLGGEPIGAVMRVHSEGDHRNNFFAGGAAEDTEITDRDAEICRALGPHLRALDLHFVGIDVIGEYLIEVNVTSPTCVQEVNRLRGVQLEDEIIAYVEGLVRNGSGVGA